MSDNYLPGLCVMCMCVCVCVLPYRKMSVPGSKRKVAPGDADDTSMVDLSSNAGDQQLVAASKKARTESESSALVTIDSNKKALITSDGTALPPRTSSLNSATMCLTGHGSAVFACGFSSNGGSFASAGADKLLFLWDLLPTGEVTNTSVLSGHTGPILDLHWSSNDRILTGSADSTAALWDVETATRVKRLRGHRGVVNSVAVSRRGETIAATGSDDCSVKLWDLRSRQPTHSFNEHYQILATTFSDDATQIFSAGM